MILKNRKGQGDIIFAMVVFISLTIGVILAVIVSNKMLDATDTLGLSATMTGVITDMEAFGWQVVNLVPIAIVGLWLGAIVLAWFLPSHPMLFVAYVLFSIIMQLLAVAASDILWEFLAISTVNDYSSNFTFVTYFVKYFPTIHAVFSVLYAIVLFSRMGEGSGDGSGGYSSSNSGGAVGV